MMTGKAFLFTLLTISLVSLSVPAIAEVYHHVHHRSPDAVAAAQWYMDHMAVYYTHLPLPTIYSV